MADERNGIQGRVMIYIRLDGRFWMYDKGTGGRGYHDMEYIGRICISNLMDVFKVNFFFRLF